MKNLKKVLATIAHNEPWTIRAFVAEEALKHDTDYLAGFFQDVARWGCISGMVSSLVWYSDTHKFFDTFYYEIMEILEDLTNEWIKVQCTGEDLKNRLAWLTFEKVAYEMAENDLGLGF